MSRKLIALSLALALCILTGCETKESGPNSSDAPEPDAPAPTPSAEFTASSEYFSYTLDEDRSYSPEASVNMDAIEKLIKSGALGEISVRLLDLGLPVQSCGSGKSAILNYDYDTAEYSSSVSYFDSYNVEGAVEVWSNEHGVDKVKAPEDISQKVFDVIYGPVDMSEEALLLSGYHYYKDEDGICSLSAPYSFDDDPSHEKAIEFIKTNVDAFGLLDSIYAGGPVMYTSPEEMQKVWPGYTIDPYTITITNINSISSDDKLYASVETDMQSRSYKEGDPAAMTRFSIGYDAEVGSNNRTLFMYSENFTINAPTEEEADEFINAIYKRYGVTDVEEIIDGENTTYAFRNINFNPFTTCAMNGHYDNDLDINGCEKYREGNTWIVESTMYIHPSNTHS